MYDQHATVFLRNRSSFRTVRALRVSCLENKDKIVEIEVGSIFLYPDFWRLYYLPWLRVLKVNRLRFLYVIRG